MISTVKGSDNIVVTPVKIMLNICLLTSHPVILSICVSAICKSMCLFPPSTIHISPILESVAPTL